MINKTSKKPESGGEWIPNVETSGMTCICSKCGFEQLTNDVIFFNFCPKCGSYMGGERVEDPV